MSETVLDHLRAALMKARAEIAILEQLVKDRESETPSANPPVSAHAHMRLVRHRQGKSIASKLRKHVPQILQEHPLDPSPLHKALDGRGINVEIKYLRSWLSIEARAGRLEKTAVGYRVLLQKTRPPEVREHV